jgi:hypothetical protein
MLSHEAVWTFKGTPPDAAMLWGAWGIEALIITALTVFGARKPVDRPYSSAGQQWMQEEKLTRCLPYVENPSLLRRQLEQKQYNILFNAGIIDNDKLASRCQVSLYSCPEDMVSYMSMTNIKGRGARKSDSSIRIVKYLALDKSTADKIRRHLGAEAR